MVRQAATLPLLPKQVLLRQLPKVANCLAVGNLHLLCQIFARIDDVNLAVPVDPAVAAGQLETVEQEGVGTLLSSDMPLYCGSEKTGFLWYSNNEK